MFTFLSLFHPFFLLFHLSSLLPAPPLFPLSLCLSLTSFLLPSFTSAFIISSIFPNYSISLPCFHPPHSLSLCLSLTLFLLPSFTFPFIISPIFPYYFLSSLLPTSYFQPPPPHSLSVFPLTSFLLPSSENKLPRTEPQVLSSPLQNF